MKNLLVLAFAIASTHALGAPLKVQGDDIKYTPGGAQFKRVWTQFYNGDHEPELDDPLIRAGKKMTPAICSAVRHRDMKFRRYAISALGHLKDRRALPTLNVIVKSRREKDYFRSDALHSIYLINRTSGTKLARAYRGRKDDLGRVAQAILKKEPWLLAPSIED